MTMQHQNHPDDELLSALAGGDPDATGNASLRAHLESCERCTSVIRELGELRVALAQLPDLPPSRPLQLVPPVPASAENGRRGGWLRRLAAPAMAAGGALVVVGGIGMGAVTLGGMASGGAPAPAFEDSGDAPESLGSSAPALDAAGGRTSRAAVPTEGTRSLATARERPTEGGGDEGTGQDLAGPSVDFNQPAPWLALLVGGAVLLFLGLMLRTAINPRAG